MNEWIPGTAYKDESAFRLFLCTLLLVILTNIWTAILWYQCNKYIHKLESRIERIENGNSYINIYDPLTGKKDRLQVVGAAQLDMKNATGPVLMPIYMTEESYANGLNKLRIRLIERYEEQKKTEK
jgi:hypothetical protein